MSDLTAREMAPMSRGDTRYFCPFPRCDFHIDHNIDVWLAEHGDSVRLPDEAFVAVSSLPDVVAEITRARMIAWFGFIEESLHAHLDSDHPDWTLADLQAHAKAYGLVDLMGGFPEGSHDVEG